MMLRGALSGAPGMLMAWSRHLQSADPMQYLRLRCRFQFLPLLIGAQHQRNVLRSFGVGVAENPRPAGMRSAVVNELELFEHNGALAALRQFPSAGKTH